MITILSPTRGGEKSYPNQDFAINLAKERGANLVFLYVSDVQFLNQMSSPVLVDVAAELEEMGEFLLAMAQERASKSGIEAEIVVRSGVFGDVIEAMIPQYEISTLVLGSSDQEGAVTTNDFLLQMSQKLADVHDLEVLLVRHGELLYSVEAKQGK